MLALAPDNIEDGQQALLARIGKRNQLEEDLVEKYERALARKHHLRYREVRGIRWEGLEGHWPMPPSPDDVVE